MGYLTDNLPPGKNHVICQDLYPFRLIVNNLGSHWTEPRYVSDAELQLLVKDVLPDIEKWQFSGRRYRPKAVRRSPRIVHPARYAQNSRPMRAFHERVVFSFHTEPQRDAAAARLRNSGFRDLTYQDEPTPNPVEGIVVVVIP